ncbi:MAG: BrnA antitoxin family protein [Porticoccaceae bacterium]|nr:BrnA antitoxin family protein [Porticoccaceae bacterium]
MSTKRKPDAPDRDNPEWTDEDFRNAKPVTALPKSLQTKLRRGRPPAETPKQQVTLRLDAEVLEYFRATGAGWQTRLNDALKEQIKRRARG